MLIYCVEDDDNIRELIVYTLTASNYRAKGFSHGKAFLTSLESELPALVLLDIMLPETDGLALLEILRKSNRTKNLPVILLTAKANEIDKIIGLDSGADDYVTKPFGMMELLSRIKAVLRRMPTTQPEEILHHQKIAIDLQKHRVFIEENERELTLKEYDLLVYFMQNKGTALSRDQILQSVWGYDVVVESRTVDAHIQTLRQKLGEQGNLIQTVRGVGYRMEA